MLRWRTNERVASARLRSRANERVGMAVLSSRRAARRGRWWIRVMRMGLRMSWSGLGGRWEGMGGRAGSGIDLFSNVVSVRMGWAVWLQS